MDKEKMNNDPQNTSEEITERIEEMIEEETETGAGTVSISDRLREAEADENDYDADVEDGYDEAEYDEADGEVDGENEYGEASEDAEYVEDEYSEEEEDDDDEPRIVVNPKVVKVASLILFSGIILVFASIAWFTMNRDVGTSGMGVQVGGPSFELAVAGDNIGAISYMGSGENSATYTGTALNDFQTGPNAADGQSGTYNISTGGTGTFYSTGGSDDVIKWRLESEYNRYDDGLGPDSRGSFTFYVVPKVSGSLTVKFSLALEGYAAEVNQNEDKSWNVTNLAKIESGDTGYGAVTYLNSHFLFFENRINTGTEQKPVYVYTDLIDKAEFEKTFNNCVVDQVIPVTIYWIWPNTIAQMSCVAENGNVATASGTVSDLQQYVVDNASNLLKGISQADAMTYMADEDTEGDETTYSFNSAKATTNLITLSNGYNKADSSIGTTVKYFLLVLEAE